MTRENWEFPNSPESRTKITFNYADYYNYYSSPYLIYNPSLLDDGDNTTASFIEEIVPVTIRGYTTDPTNLTCDGTETITSFDFGSIKTAADGSFRLDPVGGIMQIPIYDEFELDHLLMFSNPNCTIWDYRLYRIGDYGIETELGSTDPTRLIDSHIPDRAMIELRVDIPRVEMLKLSVRTISGVEQPIYINGEVCGRESIIVPEDIKIALKHNFSRDIDLVEAQKFWVMPETSLCQVNQITVYNDKDFNDRFTNRNLVNLTFDN